MTPEEFIRDCTRGCSNELGAVEDRFGKRVISYHEWLTPDQALRAVEIAREEVRRQMIKDVVEATIIKTRVTNHTMAPTLSTVILSDAFHEGDKVKVKIFKKDQL